MSGQAAMDDALGVKVGEGVCCLSEDGQLHVGGESTAPQHRVVVQGVCLDRAGDYGKLGGLHAGTHVQDDVLVSYVGQGPDVREPGLDVLVILGAAGVDDDVAVPFTKVDI